MSEKPKSELWIFYKVATAALVRAEAKGKVAERFCGDGLKRWEQFANELDKADLLDLAIRDAASPFPVPFRLHQRIGQYSGREIGINAAEAEELIGSYQDAADKDADQYLTMQADVLGVDLLHNDLTHKLPNPQAHHTILECPGTGGWLSYLIIRESDSQLYYWENFHISCSNWREAMLAGLIAFELDAPPNTALPISIDETVKDALDSNRYDWIVGKREGNDNRLLGGFVSKEDDVILI